MLKVGIDTISFYTPQFFLDLASLAKARNIDVNKYYVGLGQRKMSIAPPDEDIVTMATNAAERALSHVDINSIDTLLFATESGLDLSKAAGIYVHQLLGLPSQCRILELKQACYSCTGAIQLVLPRLQQYPDKKTLLIASDISRYGFNTPGESSQGCGAVAMVLSANPRLVTIEPEAGFHTEDVMDFWRPPYLNEALVDGKYSSKLYFGCLEKTWKHYNQLSGRQLNDHDKFCYHNSVPRLVEKAHKLLNKVNQQTHLTEEALFSQVQDAITYGRQTGNCYAASLYIGLVSLLDNCQENLSKKRIAFYSYGSGCVAEFFSGIVQPGYQAILDTEHHKKMLATRQELTYDEYKQFYSFRLPRDGSEMLTPQHNKNNFRLRKMMQHKRIYEKA